MFYMFIYIHTYTDIIGLPSSSAVKNPPAMQEMQVEKIPWRRKWQPTPDFSLRNPMDRGA